MFPHRLGLPFKRALRNLMADHLQKIIQDGGNQHVSTFLVVLPQVPKIFRVLLNKMGGALCFFNKGYGVGGCIAFMGHKDNY